MSLSSVGSSTAAQYQPQNTQSSQIRNDLKQLTQAIKSGDLTTAQSAYSDLTTLLQQQSDDSSSSSSSTTSTDASNSNSNPLQQFLQQVGAALGNNDLQGAQQALTTLQQARGAHGHHHHGGGGGAEANAQTPGQDSSSSSTTVNISISGASSVSVIA